MMSRAELLEWVQALPTDAEIGLQGANTSRNVCKGSDHKIIEQKEDKRK